MLTPAGGLCQQTGEPAVPFEPVRLGFIDFVPHSYMVDGVPHGPFLLDAIEVFEREGLKYELVQLPIARLYQAIQSGRIHVWPGISGHAGHDAATIFVEEPVNMLRLRLYGRQMPPLISDIYAERLIVIAGFRYGGLLDRLATLERKMTLVPARDHASAFELLGVGRAPYVLDYKLPADDAIVALGLEGLQERVVQDLPIHFYISKFGPDPSRLLEQMTRGQAAMQAARGDANPLPQ